MKKPTLAFKKCVCKNEYQDGKYGVGVRLHNRTYVSKSYKPKGWRCTVCAHHIEDRED